MIRIPSRQTPYGNIANIYDALFLTLTGFKRGVEKFLDRTDFNLPRRSRLLDAGCGTGLITCYLAKRFPNAKIWATDIDLGMLRAMEREMNQSGIDRKRISVARADLTAPERCQLLSSREVVSLTPASFDGIFVSGALEHVPLEPAIARLSRLLKPGGVFFNLWVRKNPAGAVLGMIYNFRPYGISEMRQACIKAGLEDIKVIKLSAEDFPANLSRIAIMARKQMQINCTELGLVQMHTVHLYQ